ncbi:XRE family transcriptional regulator [Streptomyces sp. CNQ-509]|uniref:helix-turn-helix domain-containing protein n=1 Tax=Streptomyces sp. CNQ-509 TaxID=444103 RepID=UPI00062DE310|nr:helix-turn-helix transcriptional regulator [Streptomyces sp. CNQ-509]AKH80964.1 XRE family transcriptional regulator [Streptomyces sp. CNQ-509]
MRDEPAVRRAKLGAELRRLRGSAGLTSGKAAELVGWHQSKISRIETGRSAAKAADVARLLDAYGVTEPELRTLLETPATAPHECREDRWWSEYRELLPAAYRDFISLEAEATTVRTLETSVVPGLLQTRRYALAVTRAAVANAAPREVESLVEVRIARQAVLRATHPPHLHAVLDEAVLRRHVGGPGVMAEQLHHLGRMGALPYVHVQILPFSAGEHVGLTGPFVIFSYSRSSDLDVVVVDHLMSSLHLERKEDLRAYETTFASLQASALSHEESLSFIAALGAGAKEAP